MRYLCEVDKRKKILKAALKLLVENGLHATPVSAIAKAAGTGMGTIYNYFESKEVLINVIYTEIKAEEQQLLAQFDEQVPIKIQFERYYNSVIDFFIENPLYFQFMEQLHASPIITEESRAAGYQTITPMIHMLEKGQQERIIKSIAVDEILQYLGGTVFSYLRHYHQKPAIDKQSTLNNLLQMVWDGVKA